MGDVPLIWILCTFRTPLVELGTRKPIDWSLKPWTQKWPAYGSQAKNKKQLHDHPRWPKTGDFQRDSHLNINARNGQGDGPTRAKGHLRFSSSPKESSSLARGVPSRLSRGFFRTWSKQTDPPLSKTHTTSHFFPPPGVQKGRSLQETSDKPFKLISPNHPRKGTFQLPPSSSVSRSRTPPSNITFPQRIRHDSPFLQLPLSNTSPKGNPF